MTGHRNRARARTIPLSDLRRTLLGMIGMIGLMIAALVAQAALADDHVIRSHGYSYYGELSYPPDFEHFNYVNPEAPKGGEISLYAPGTFDSMNP